MKKREYLPAKATLLIEEAKVNLDLPKEAKEKFRECYNKSLSITRPETVYFDDWYDELVICFSNEKCLSLKLEDILKEHEEAIYELMKDEAQVHDEVVKIEQESTKKVVLNKCWGGFDLSKEAKDLFVKRNVSKSPLTRDNPILVQIVEELGERANGRNAYLEIVEIPANMEYVIDDDDGWETLHQKVKEW